MNQAHRTPFLVPFLAFAAGISLAGIWIEKTAILLMLLVLSVGGWGFWLRLKRGSFRGAALSWGTLILGIFLLGSSWYRIREYKIPIRTVSIPTESQLRLAGVLEKSFRRSPKGSKAQLLVYAVRKEGDAWRPIRERIQLFVRDSVPEIMPGDTLFAMVRMKLLETESESYAAYLKKEGLRFIAFSQWISPGGKGQGILLTASRWQKKLARYWDIFLENERYAGIAKAMFLGDKAGLDHDMRESFSTAGFSHLLAISGLHVGILAALLGFVAKPFSASYFGRMGGTILILFSLALFTFVSGASPSVIRASSMLGVYYLVRLFYRRIHPINVWALCGFLQLILVPDDLFSIGFQLSYLAVLALIWLFPKFTEWVKTDQKWLNYIYNIIGINLLATLATAPLVWYYFGVFPTYFLIANLIVVPVIFLLVFFGFLTVLISLFSPGLASYIAWLCEKGLWYLDFVAHLIEKLPYAKLTQWQEQERGWAIVGLEVFLAILFVLLPSFWKRLQGKWELKLTSNI